jgi:hypothetical protein
MIKKCGFLQITRMTALSSLPSFRLPCRSITFQNAYLINSHKNQDLNPLEKYEKLSENLTPMQPPSLPQCGNEVNKYPI